MDVALGTRNQMKYRSHLLLKPSPSKLSLPHPYPLEQAAHPPLEDVDT